MYDQSKDDYNIAKVKTNMVLRSSSKIKLKCNFTRLANIQRSPYYCGCELWNNIPHELQNEPNKLQFKKITRNYQFD